MKAIVPWLLAAVFAVQAGAFIANSSGTYDETVYLRQAEGLFQRHDNADLAAKGVAPLPVVLLYALPAVNFVPDYAQAILLARAGAVALVGVPIVLVVYFWTAAEAGAAPAAVAGALVALSPNIVAHGSLATTDACFVLFALLLLWALARYVDRPTWGRMAALVAAGALAFAAKYSAAALFGVTAIVLAWLDRPGRRLPVRVAAGIAVAAAMALAGLAATWNFHPIDGFLAQASHQRLGHEGFLFGRRSSSGWWYYQPAALVLKSTPVELAAFALAAAALVRNGSVASRVCGIAAAVLLGMSMASRVSIGVRYVLILIPLAVIGATAGLARMLANRPRTAAAIGAAAVLAQAAAAIGAAPRNLSYFNGIAGGPMNGYRLLADSNLDWGQDLPAIRQILASLGARQPVAAYFGTAPPEAYGVTARLWSTAPEDAKAKADWIVISATYLAGLYLENDPFEGFRSVEPFARPTPAIFVYDTSRPDVKAALARAIARSP